MVQYRKIPPRFVVIDLSELMEQFMHYEQHYRLFKLFPLRDIVGTILMTGYEDPDNELLWFETVDNRLKDQIDNFNVDIIQFFYDQLECELDIHLRRKFPREYDYAKYLFDRWLGGGSVILKRQD